MTAGDLLTPRYVSPSDSILLPESEKDVSDGPTVLSEKLESPIFFGDEDIKPIELVATGSGSPNSYNKMRAQAMFAAQCNQYLTAIIRFTKIEFNYGLKIQDRYHRAFASLGRKHHEFALADGMAMIEESRQNYRGYWIAGIAYERLKQFEKARQIYSKGVDELNRLMQLNGRSFSGLVSGRMVLAGCIKALDAKDDMAPAFVTLPTDAQVKQQQEAPLENQSTNFVEDVRIKLQKAQNKPVLDQAVYFPVEIMLHIFKYINLDFREAVQLDSLNSSWRRALRSAPQYWKVLDLRRINWEYMSKELIADYVESAAGVTEVLFNWVIANANEDTYDDNWYELVWWIASLQKRTKISSSPTCTFKITACVPYLAKHKSTKGMLAIPWGPTRSFAIPQNLVSELLEALAERKTARPTSLDLFNLPLESLVKQLSWDEDVEPGWALDEFSQL
ncbi:hypothetical protein V1512DRAFT_18558 [Lipomyces arxii]|uniref:uncharacterized protein n=1 Tax=Lipomyces arxii TaxID=56418 RepID=UPI0034D0039E